jgi:hypothetical protein
MKPQSQEQHQWLQKLVGEWTYEHECRAGPDKPPQKLAGSESVRSLGGVWVLCEGKGAMPDGSPAITLMTLGYDPKKERFIGSFVGSMMTHMWVYDGELNAAATALTLFTEGPGFTPDGKPLDKLAKYKDVIEFKSDDHRVLMSYTLGEDGNWCPFMTAHYRRKR